MSPRTPFAYIAISGLCFVLHNAVMISADAAAIPLGEAVLLSFGVVVGMGYTLHALFTFRQRLTPLAFARYVFAMSANIPLAYVTTWLLHELAGLPMIFAAPLASLCMLAVNFVLGRWAISSTHRQVTC